MPGSCYDKALRYALQMIQTTQTPKNDISVALDSLKLTLKIHDLIQ